jgi:hypothetical protein
MALFTDGPVSSIEDLTGQDSQLLEVANAEGIDVTQKLALARDELAVELGTLLTRLSSLEQPFWYSASLNLASVVVTPALKLWHTFRALEMVYRDAYNSQLNDRYAGKRDQFHEMAQWAHEKLIQTGIGIAPDPVPQAATPDVATAQGNLPDGTYYATMSWINGAGEEGACAAPAAILIAGGTLLVRPGQAPKTATGWNVYVGAAPNAMLLQNASPIAVGQIWLQPDTVNTAGRAPGTGQSPSYARPVPRVIPRG